MTGPPTRNGEGLGQLSKVPSTRGKSYQLKQEGEWWIIMLMSFDNMDS
jgi:hypothetical protein